MASLETSFLIDVLRGHEPARDVMEDLDAASVRPTVTPVAAAEVWIGAAYGSEREGRMAGELLESLTWLPFTRAAARLAGEIRAELIRGGSPIGITDAMTAGIVVEHDEVLVTRDEHYDRVPGLRVRSY